MGTYLLNFIVYSMAMVGLLFICLVVYKKTMANGKCTKNNDEMLVENALNLSPRKTIYVVKVGDEKFLIAGDAERTTFLAKLDERALVSEKITTVPVEMVEQPPKIQQEHTHVDYSEVMNKIRMTKKKQPVMREILRKLDEQSVAIHKNISEKNT